LCSWCNVCHSTTFQENIGILQHKINGNPVCGLNFTCENDAGNMFRRTVICLIVRSLEILSLWSTWWEMLNVPSLTVWAFKHTKIKEISTFVPRKNFGSNYSSLLLYLFPLLLLFYCCCCCFCCCCYCCCTLYWKIT
jgi:hypothetical protein